MPLNNPSVVLTKSAEPASSAVTLSGAELNASASTALRWSIDDGVGSARLCDGDGLRGLQDRVDAYSGVLHIDSRVGNGTRITATLPCA